MNHYFVIKNLINRLHLNLSWVFISRLIRFAIVGFSGVFADVGVFYVLHRFLGWLLTPSAMLSTEVAIINNFLWNDVWTFGELAAQKPSVNQRLQRFLKFNIICLTGLILNVLIMFFWVYQFGINEYMAKLIAIICVTFWNFSLNLRLNWQINETTES